MDIVINYWAVLGAAVAMMVIGALWYGPIFGRVWMKLMGYDRQSMKDMKLKPPAAMSLMFLAALLSAGFVTFTPGNGLVVHPGRSESLNLGPAPTDQAYLNAAYTASLRLNEVSASIPY